MAVTDDIQATIEQARATADEKSTAAQAFAEAAVQKASTSIDYTLYDPKQPKVVIPNFTPDIDISELLDLASDNTILIFQHRFREEFTNFINSYFPDFNEHLTHVHDKLHDMIFNGGTGLPPSIEQAIHDRARSRIVAEQLSQEGQIYDTFAARGFSMPPGVMLAGIERLRDQTLSRVAETSKDIAIEAAKIEVENLKFAIEKAANYRIDIIRTAVDYIRAHFVTVLDQGVRKAELLVSAKKALWDASTQYFEVLIRNGALALDYEKLQTDKSVSNAGLFVDFVTKNASSAATAAIGAAEAMGHIAAAALGSQNTLSTQTIEAIAQE